VCDYSLMAIPNRLAVSGEDLIVHRFAEGTLGLASPSDIRRNKESRNAQSLWRRFKQFFAPDETVPAVCIPPGARLIVRDIPQDLQHMFGLRDDMEQAVFAQLTACADSYRDALRFNNGTEVLLQRLHRGQRVRVISVSSADDAEPAPQGQQSIAFSRWG